MKETLMGSLAHVCSNTTAQDVSAQRIDRAKLVGYNYICAIDETNVPTNIEIGFTRGAAFIPLTSGVPSAGAISVDLPGPVYVPEGYALTARFKGATAADILRLSWVGFVEV